MKEKEHQPAIIIAVSAGTGAGVPPAPERRRKHRGKITPLDIPRDPLTHRHPVCGEIARILRKTREFWGFSRYKLAVLSGVSAAMIKKIELGSRVPTVDVLVRLCTALDLEPLELFAEVWGPWSRYVQPRDTIVR